MKTFVNGNCKREFYTLGFLFLLQNPNITWEIVKENPNKPWDFSMLSHNEMKTEKYTQLKKSVNIISNWYFEIRYNPNSKICQKWIEKIQLKFYTK